MFLNISYIFGIPPPLPMFLNISAIPPPANGLVYYLLGFCEYVTFPAPEVSEPHYLMI